MFQSDVDYEINQKACMEFSKQQPEPNATYKAKNGDVYRVYGFSYPVGARTVFTQTLRKYPDPKSKKMIEEYETPNAQNYDIKEPVVFLLEKNGQNKWVPSSEVLTGSEWIKLEMTLISEAEATSAPKRILKALKAQEKFLGANDANEGTKAGATPKATIVPPVE